MDSVTRLHHEIIVYPRSQNSHFGYLLRLHVTISMVEGVLYNNFNEPRFPFELVIHHLDWLPAYVSSQQRIPFDHARNRNLDLFPCILIQSSSSQELRTAAFHHVQDLRHPPITCILTPFGINQCRGVSSQIGARTARAVISSLSHGAIVLVSIRSPDSLTLKLVRILTFMPLGIFRPSPMVLFNSSNV